MNKFNLIDIVNSRYLNPKNIISAIMEGLAQQPVFDGGDFPDSASFDPADNVGGEVERAVPAEVVYLDNEEDVGPDSFEVGTVVEETLSGSINSFFTTLPFDYFEAVWFNGLEANYLVHYTLSGTNQLMTNTDLMIGTQVYGRYVLGNN